MSAFTESSDPREDKLPRWTQDLLRRLRREISDRQAEIGALRHEFPAESDTFVEPHVHPAIPLGVGTAVRFSLDMHRRYVEVRIRDGRIDVHGNTQLVVRPRVSNGFTIDVEDR